MPAVKAITIEFKRECVCFRLSPDAMTKEPARFNEGHQLSGVPSAYVR